MRSATRKSAKTVSEMAGCATPLGGAMQGRLARCVLEQAQGACLFTLKLRRRPSASNADHRAILQAIKARDPDRACERMRAHRLRGMDVLLPLLEALSTNPSFLHRNDRIPAYMH